MPQQAMSQSYTASDIEVLSGLEPVRRRPGMYTDTRSPNHLAHEVVDALLAASLGSKDDTAFATVEVRGFTAAKLRTIVETWAGRPL